MSDKTRPVQKLWAIVGYENDRDLVKFDNWAEYILWKQKTKCTVIRLIKGIEQDLEIEKKTA